MLELCRRLWSCRGVSLMCSTRLRHCDGDQGLGACTCLWTAKDRLYSATSKMQSSIHHQSHDGVGSYRLKWRVGSEVVVVVWELGRHAFTCCGSAERATQLCLRL